MTPDPGAAIRIEMSKWGDRPHWAFDAVFLGSDEHGDWCGIPAGTYMSRPGAEYLATSDQVGLVPAPGPDADRGWLATFHAPGGHYSPSLGTVVEVYVDITTPPTWDGHVLRAIDLDLDVVRGTTGRVWVDDEDEFARHRTEFGYPEDVATSAVRSCEMVHAAVRARSTPYDGIASQPWLAMAVDLPRPERA